MSTPSDDPTRVSDETLRTFEAGMRPAVEAISVAKRPPSRQGLLLLVGMAACITIGLAYVLALLL
jgi:hypothetical protein